ncbi:hypothetical protein F4557_000286 [Actinomadura catellatispora]|uniref:Uncharacterized protein n=1 Tax=Actinomadura livida TaxID=79909 RepID=A0A7W7I7I6_9ACTN|nr:hypothetical protein [Actinomadura catellatispora]
MLVTGSPRCDITVRIGIGQARLTDADSFCALSSATTCCLTIA